MHNQTVYKCLLIMAISLLIFVTVFLLVETSYEDNCVTVISRENWGETFDKLSQSKKTVIKYTLTNCNKIKVQLISYGASIISISTPDFKGVYDDIVLGFDDIEGYQRPENAYLGATIGRVANRIGNATFSLPSEDKKNVFVYNLDKNDGTNMIHGGFHSFGKIFWEDCPRKLRSGNVVTFCYNSPDGEGGFPGNVFASVSYELNSKNELRIQFSAKTDKPTPINMANHAYFNLAGHKAGSLEIYEHVVSIYADKYTAVDKNVLPTGEVKSVERTPYDLRNLTNLGLAISISLPGGYDINYVLSCWEKEAANNKELKTPCLAARIFHPASKRTLSVYTNQPGLQFYTANGLNTTGKQGVYYKKQSAFCMESQHFPDSVNHPNFPNTVLKPGETYSRETVYKFELATV